MSKSMSFRQFVVFVLAFSLGIAIGQNDVEENSRVYQGHIYQIVNGTLDWYAANQDAQEQIRCSVHGHLVSITSPDEQNIVESIVNDSMVVDSAWIGLNDLNHDGTFRWTTGEPLNYQNWGDLEPNDALDAEDCVHMGTWWNDVGCDAINLPYIVEFECELTEIFQGHVYQINGNAKDWNSANDDALSQTQCEVQGHLVTIGSQEEHDFIVALYQSSKIKAEGAWIGLSDFQSEGSFEWVTKEPLNFTAWGAGKPDNMFASTSMSEDCVNLWAAEFLWNDYLCSSLELPYIMEFDCNVDPTENPARAPTNDATTVSVNPKTSSMTGLKYLAVLGLVPILLVLIWVLRRNKRGLARNPIEDSEEDPSTIQQVPDTHSSISGIPLCVPTFRADATQNVSLPTFKNQVESMAGPPIVDGVPVVSMVDTPVAYCWPN